MYKYILLQWLEMKTILDNMKWQKPFLVLLISTYLMSCTHWKVLKEPYREQIEKDKPNVIKVESVYGRKIILKNPNIVGDSLLAIYERNDPMTFQIKSDTIYVSMDEIRQIKKETVNPIVVAGLVGVLVGMYISGPNLIWAIRFGLSR